MKSFYFAVCLFGAAKAGKTSLITRYCSQVFSHTEQSAKTECEVKTTYETEPCSVYLRFYEDTKMKADCYIVCVDLRQPQAVVDDQIARHARTVSFKTASRPIVLGLCSDMAQSNLRACGFPFAEVSSVSGQGVNDFFSRVVYNLVAKEMKAYREENAFQALDFTAKEHVNRETITKDSVASYADSHGLASFVMSAVLEACEYMPADFRTWMRDRCRERAVSSANQHAKTK